MRILVEDIEQAMRDACAEINRLREINKEVLTACSRALEVFKSLHASSEPVEQAELEPDIRMFEAVIAKAKGE